MSADTYRLYKCEIDSTDGEDYLVYEIQQFKRRWFRKRWVAVDWFGIQVGEYTEATLDHYAKCAFERRVARLMSPVVATYDHA